MPRKEINKQVQKSLQHKSKVTQKYPKPKTCMIRTYSVYTVVLMHEVFAYPFIHWLHNYSPEIAYLQYVLLLYSEVWCSKLYSHCNTFYGIYDVHTQCYVDEHSCRQTWKYLDMNIYAHITGIVINQTICVRDYFTNGYVP